MVEKGVDGYFESYEIDRGTRDYTFVLEPVMGIGDGDILENILFAFLETDYAGLHASDVNWYEDGEFQTGILSPQLYDLFNTYLREERKGKSVLSDDQKLTAECYFSTIRDGLYISMAPALLIQVVGGELESWGQFAAICLEDPAMLQKKNDPKMIKAYAEMALQQLSSDEV